MEAILSLSGSASGLFINECGLYKKQEAESKKGENTGRESVGVSDHDAGADHQIQDDAKNRQHDEDDVVRHDESDHDTAKQQ